MLLGNLLHAVSRALGFIALVFGRLAYRCHRAGDAAHFRALGYYPGDLDDGDD